FWGLELHVEPGVFIPRPETEHVVEVALAIVRERLQKPAACIVDVGTGTGCIALALASELPEAEIVATDISAQALAVARRNAEALGLAHRVRFVECDLLEAFLAPPHEPRFDLIVSNPPYVGRDEAERLPREVRDHEPPTALFSEGVALTCRLIEQAEPLLAGGASLDASANLAGRGFSPAEKHQENSGAFRSDVGPASGGAGGVGAPRRSRTIGTEIPPWREAPEGDRPQRLKPKISGTADVRASRKERGIFAALRKALTRQRLGPPSEASNSDRAGPARRSLQGAGGWLVLELGYSMAGRVRGLLGDAWRNVEATHDLRGIPRVLAAQRK
ncbi:MAG: N5-glutamine methyltransferase family protein, partial [Acidobacteriota bacterium]